MKPRTIKSITTVDPQPGTGILHPFPTEQLPYIDPFVFLDTGAPQNLGGRGIFVGPQLWVNVPAALKMAPPEHHGVAAQDIPVLTSLGAGSTVRLYAGALDRQTGPAPLPTPVIVAHVALNAGGAVAIPVPRGWNAAFTVVDGQLDAHDPRPMAPGDTCVFNDDGESIHVSSSSGGEFLLMCGEPIGEPIAMGGGFVMNREQEVAQAFGDYRAGRMGQLESSR